MDLPDDFRGLIDLWPNKRAFGREVCGDTERGRIFHRRNRAPARLHGAIVAAAAARGIAGVTHDYLAGLWNAGRRQGR